MADLPKDFSPSHPDWGIPSKMAKWKLQGGDQLMRDYRAEKAAKLKALYNKSPSQDENKLITSEFELNKQIEPTKTVSTPSNPFEAAGFIREPGIEKPVLKPETIKRVSTRGKTVKSSKKRQKTRSN